MGGTKIFPYQPESHVDTSVTTATTHTSQYTMTKIDKKYVKEEEYSETVQTCDVCGLDETILPDSESINRIQSGIQEVSEYVLQVHEYDGEPEGDSDFVDSYTKRFETYSEAREFCSGLDLSNKDIGRHMITHLSWDLDIDVCENCEKMVFGAMHK